MGISIDLDIIQVVNTLILSRQEVGQGILQVSFGIFPKISGRYQKIPVSFGIFQENLWKIPKDTGIFWYLPEIFGKIPKDTWRHFPVIFMTYQVNLTFSFVHQDLQ